MNATEYFIKKNSKEEYEAQSYDYTPNDLAEFAEDYYQYKSKEEGQKRYEQAVRLLNDGRDITEALWWAVGLKEEDNQ